MPLKLAHKRLPWNEVVQNGIDWLEQRIPNFKKKQFKDWYQIKSYVGKPFDYFLIYRCFLIKQLMKKDRDFFTVITGLEGLGKSTLGINLCSMVDMFFGIKQTCFVQSELFDALDGAKNNSILVDEGGTILFSREAMRSDNISLNKLFMTLRARNLNFVICIPNFFNLDRTIREHRVNMLLHVHKRGHYRMFTKEAIDLINKYSLKNKNVMATKIPNGSFYDGKFYKSIPDTYNYNHYLVKKDDNITRFIKRSKKDAKNKEKGGSDPK